MLERVPATAESAAHVLLRTVEKPYPYHSNRALDARFWRNGADQIPSASWWPLYLHHIRQVPQFQSGPSTEQPTTARSLSSTPWKAKRVLVAQDHVPARQFTISSPSQKQKQKQKQKPKQKQKEVFDVFGLSDSHESVTELVDDEEPHFMKRGDSTNFLQGVERFQARHRKDDVDEDAERHHPFTDLFGRSDLDPGLSSIAIAASHVADSEDMTGTESGTAEFVNPFGLPDVLTDINDIEDTEDVATSNDRQEQSIHALQQEVVQQAKPKRLTVAGKRLQDLETLLAMQQNATEDQLDTAWLLFIALDHQEKHAASVLRFLVQSTSSKAASRAREAFRLVPPELRTQQVYEAAISVFRRSQQPEAVNLALEARSRGYDLVPDLFAYFIERLLWNSAAELLYRNQNTPIHPPSRIKQPLSEEARPHSAADEPPWAKDNADWDPSTVNMKIKFKDIFHQCTAMKSLHLKAVDLAARLKQEDLALSEHLSILRGLCRTLAVRSVRIPSIIATTTASSLLALFDLQKDLGNWNLHAKALETMKGLSKDQRNPDLALMTYRNFVSTMPGEVVKKPMLEALIDICRDARYPLHVHDYILGEYTKHFGHPDAQAFQKVMTACANQGNLTAVEKVFESYIKLYGKPRGLPYLSPFIYACAVNGDTEGARRHFQRIQTKYGLKPNHVCWSMLLLAHARSVDDLSTFDVFQEMQKSGTNPGSYGYGILLAVCEAHADIETALELLIEARDAGVYISVPMINTVVEIYLAHDDVKSAYNFATTVTESGTAEPLTRIWNRILRYYAAKGRSDAIKETRSLMAKHNIVADSHTYASLISGLVITGKTSDALNLMREMHYGKGITATPLHYSLLLNGFVREGNRDMATVIYHEMRQRFHMNSAAADQAMLRMKVQRDLAGSDPSYTHSTNFLVTVLKDLYAPGGDVAVSDGTSGKQKQKAIIAFQQLEILLESLIENNSYDQAEQLLQHMDEFSTRLPTSKVYTSSTKIMVARMDLSIARHDYDGVKQIWYQLFEQASRELKSISALRIGGVDQLNKPGTQHLINGSVIKDSPSTTLPSSKVLKAHAMVLSKPLGRYMEAMALAGQTSEMINFLKDKFEPAGFELSGVNWNKYVQILSRSGKARHRISAFVVMEKTMINRAQSWDLLRKGLLRRTTTSYIFEKVAPQMPRPILQKQNTLDVVKRKDAIFSDPRQRIPTYTTMVHLGAALSKAEQNARLRSNHKEFELIARVARKTKQFLETMPKLKDDIQGELLRRNEERAYPIPAKPTPLPRSEEAIQKEVIARGVLGSAALADEHQNDHRHDVTVSRYTTTLRARLRGTGNDAKQLLVSPDKDPRSVDIAKRHADQLLVIVAREGRFETEEERIIRIQQEEERNQRFLESELQSIQQRALLSPIYSRDLDSPVGIPDEIDSPPCQSLSYSEVSPQAYSDKFQEAPLEEPPGATVLKLPQVPSEKFQSITSENPNLGTNKSLSDRLTNIHLQRPPLAADVPRADKNRESKPVIRHVVMPEIAQPVPLAKQSVLEQLAALRTKRQEIIERSVDTTGPRPRRFAIPYAETRRVERSLAARQRREAAELVEPLVEENSLSSRATAVRTEAQRQRNIKIMSTRRRGVYLEYERDLKAGKRLPPFPFNKTAYRRRRARHGQAPVRFIADLGRSSKTYPTRRGRMPERRAPEVAKDGQEDTLVQPDGSLQLERRRRMLKKKQGQVKQVVEKYLVQTRTRPDAHRRRLRQRLALRRGHLQDRARKILGNETFERRLAEKRADSPTTFTPLW